MILVTGATGGIGGELCKLLGEAGVSFRAMCRKHEQVDSFHKHGVDAVLGDLSRPETLQAAMQGCDQVFLVTPATPDQVKLETAAIDAAKRAGVRKIVEVSTSDSNVRSSIPWAKSHAQIDHHLRRSGLSWTILKPTGFMQNFLWFKDPIARGFLPQVTGSGSVPWIDTRDIARVAATVLTQDGHDSATYFLTGPQTMDMKAIAGTFSQLLGHRVRFLNIPKAALWGILRLTGNSPWMAKGLIVQFADHVAGHHDIDPTHEIERLTGKPPRDFAAFATDHLKAFRKAPSV